MVIHILQVRKPNWTDWVAERHTEIVDGMKSIIWRQDVNLLKVFGLCHWLLILLQCCSHKTEHPSVIRPPWLKILSPHKVSVLPNLSTTHRFSETVVFHGYSFLCFKSHLMLGNILMGRERGPVIIWAFHVFVPAVQANQAHSQRASQKAAALLKADALCAISSIEISVTLVQEVVGNGGILLLFFLPLMHLFLSSILFELYLQLKLS